MPFAGLLARLIPWLLGGLLELAVSLAGRVLIGLGIGVFTVAGLSLTLNWLKSQAVSYLLSLGSMAGGLGADLLTLVGYMKVGVAISIIFSAWSVRLTIQGLSVGGSISRMAMKYWKG